MEKTINNYPTFPASPSANISYPKEFSTSQIAPQLEEEKQKDVALEDKKSTTEYVAYNSHRMLNPPFLTATSGITCIDSFQYYETKRMKEDYEEEGYRDLLVEIMDCRGKIRLHNRGGDLEDFKSKIRVLRDELDSFLTHLDETPTPKEVVEKAKKKFPNRYK